MGTEAQGTRTSQRKRKRPLPASDSSKSTTTNSGSGGQRGGGTCPISASICSSSATTQSLSGNVSAKKRAREEEGAEAEAAADVGMDVARAEERREGGGGGGGSDTAGHDSEGAGAATSSGAALAASGSTPSPEREEATEASATAASGGGASRAAALGEGTEAGATTEGGAGGGGGGRGRGKGRKGKGGAKSKSLVKAGGGRKAGASAAAAAAAGAGVVGKAKGRSEMVRRVEKLVVTMFKELDVLLRAEDINRRVMYRWSGAERTSVTLGEGKTSYCTWGRELIKQYIEDAIELVRTSLTTGDWDNSVEAARRLTLQYVAKAGDRNIVYNEPVLHAEVMSTLGNLWFALLPYMPPPQRQQFRRLVARLRKTGGGGGGGGGGKEADGAEAGNGGAIVAATGSAPAGAGAAGAKAKAKATSGAGAWAEGSSLNGNGKEEEDGEEEGRGLVVSFRCALEFAKLDLSPEALAAQGPQETQTKLAALLVSDVYDCDAYICLWKVSEVLAGLPQFRVLCQEFRLKALDAEMWRCMLLEEQETRQRGGSDDSDEDSDDYDDDDDDDELGMDEDEDEEGPTQGAGSGGGGGHRQGEEAKDRLSVRKLAAIPGIVGMKKFDHMQQMLQQHQAAPPPARSPPATVAAAAAAPTGSPRLPPRAAAAAPQPGSPKQQQQAQQQQRPLAAGAFFFPAAGSGNTNTAAAASSTPQPPASAPVPAPAPAPLPLVRRRSAVVDSAVSSKFSSLRRSSALDGQGSASRAGGVGGAGAGGGGGVAERWRTKAALEDGEYDQYMDFMSLHQHEYRRVMTPDFLYRVWTFLEAFEPVAGGGTLTAPVPGATAAASTAPVASKPSSNAKPQQQREEERKQEPSPRAARATAGSRGGGEGKDEAGASASLSARPPMVGAPAAPLALPPPPSSSSVLTPGQLLFIRARPFLYRVATMIPTEELNGFLDLLAAKFGYQPTLQLLEPMIVDEQAVFSTGRVAQALEWAIDTEQGRHLPLFTRVLLPRIQSRTQLERIARRAIAHGLPSLPILDRALARVPRPSYEALAVALCRRAVECWGVGQGAHLVVLRALQGMPSLGLYLKCRGCFLDPVPTLVRPLVHQLDPMGELSIGIRLVEGIVQSAVNSIVASLESTRPHSPERRDKGRRWLDFCFAGVRGGQFPPGLLDRLFANQVFLVAALGPPSKEPSCVEALAGCFARLANLARQPNIHPSAINGPVQSILNTYMHHAPKDLILKAANEKGIEVAA